MIEVIPGFWAPEKGHGSRFFDDPMPNGVPAHNFERARACIEACGDRVRAAIDGGAYVGTFAAHLVGTFASIIAVEPAPDNFECLKKNLGSKPEVLCVNAALSSQLGTVTLKPKRVTKNGTLHQKAFGWQVCDESSEGTVEVSSLAVDDFKVGSLDLLKLDVEGHELQALKGARETLQRCKPVVLIEDKLDPLKLATHYLQGIGMRLIWSQKHDYLFVW